MWTDFVLASMLCATLSGANVVADDPTAQATALVEEVIVDVAELRGLEFKRPVPVQVIDDDQAREHALQRLRSFQSEEHLRQVERSYKLLGLLPPEADILQSYLDALREQAGGFYDPPSGSFYLLDDIPPGLATVVIAHELTHALEDQHFDLDGRLRDAIRDDDRLFALAAVHEGSATLLMTTYVGRRMLSGDLEPAALMAVAESEAAKAEVLNSLPAVLRRQLVAPYVLGAAFLADGEILTVISRGYPAERIDRAFADGPLSSEQILHPVKYWDDASRDAPRSVDLGGAGRVLGEAWRKELDGVLGEMTLGVLVGAPTPTDLQNVLEVHDPSNWTNEAAAGWGGDRWELWTNDGEAVVLLATVWDSPADAGQFAAALAEKPELACKVSGDRVAVVAGDAGKKTKKLLSRILKAQS